MSYGEVLVDKSASDLTLRVLDYIVTISFGYILNCVFTCTVLVLNCFVMRVCMCGFCTVCVCVGFVLCVYVWVLYCVCMCGFCNVCVLVTFIY